VFANRRVEEPNAELLLQVHLVALGLNTDLGNILVLRNHVDPTAIAFFGHNGVLIKCWILFWWAD
jgi:hypothetical protein